MRKTSRYASLRKIIDKANSQFAKNRLRSDAKLFLLLNFGEMVAGPLAKANVPQTTITRDIEKDIQTVVKLAADIVPASDQISSHQVVSAVNVMWGKMKSLAHKIWD